MALPTRSRKQKMLAAVALAAVIAGATIAVVIATGQDDSASQRRDTVRGGRGQPPRLAPRGDLAIAVTYLGLTPAQLLDGLRSGKTLAQVASSTRGRSAAGLIDRIVAVRKSALTTAAASGQLTSAQERSAIAGLRSRVLARVNRVGAYNSAVGRRALPAPAAAAAYLGIAQRQLRNELRSGRTLAQLANGAKGKSANGLIAAIVAGTKARLAVAVAKGSLTPASEKQLLARLQRRVTAQVYGEASEGAGVR